MRLETREGLRILGLWVGAALAGGLLAAAVRLTLTPALDDWVSLHATSTTSLDGGYLAVKAGITFVSAVVVAVPLAVVLGRRLRGIEIPWLAAGVVAALVAFVIPIGALLGSAGWTTYLLASAPAPQPSFVLFPLISGVVTGCVFGLAQAIVLRQYIRGVVWWIAASIFSYGLAGVSIYLVNWQIIGAGSRLTTSTDLYAETFAGAVLGPLIVGLVTGLVLVHLLAESNPGRTGGRDLAT